MAVTPRPREILAAIIAELGRRDRLRSLVAQAGFVPDDGKWLRRAEVTRAVCKALDVGLSEQIGSELRTLLKEDGWRERRNSGHWQWRARRKR